MKLISLFALIGALMAGCINHVSGYTDNNLRAVALNKKHLKGNSTPNDTFCSIVSSALPSECSCTSNDDGGNIQCNIDIFSTDVDFAADVEPCASTADIVFSVSVGGTTYLSKTVSLDDDEQIDIPGLTFGIPGIASASAVLDVDVSGDLDQITFDLALNACASVLGVQVCGSDLTSDLPWTILSETFDLSPICQ
jgi:hypothetical protein